VTTNEHSLEKHLPRLKTTRLTKINVNVDGLDEGRFHSITRCGDLRRVLKSLFRARDMGFEVKLNAIIFRGINDEEGSISRVCPRTKASRCASWNT